MRRILLSIAAVAALSATLTSCKNDTYDINLAPSYATAPVTVHAIHYDTNRGLDSVTVEVVGRGLAATTDANGCVTFELSAGNYELRMTRPGYLPVSRDFVVELANDQSDLPIMKTTLTDQRLYPLTGAVTGRVTLDDGEKTRYQANAAVRISFTLNEGKSDAVYLTTTDTEGLYAVDSLPEGLELSCEASYIEGNTVYDGTQQVAALKTGQILGVQTIEMTRSVSSYGSDILTLPEQPADPLTIVFPVAADVDAIESGDILVRNAAGTRVGIEITWSEGNRTLVIRSADSDGWRTGTLQDYNFTVQVPNVEGGDLTASGSFGIERNESMPGAVQANFSAETRTITWDAVDGASSYNVYVKSPVDNDYELKLTERPAATATEVSLAVNSLLTDGLGLYRVKIVGANSRYEGNLSLADGLTIANINPDNVYFNSAADMLTWSHIEGVAYYRVMRYNVSSDSWSQVIRVPAPTEGTSVSVDLTGELGSGSYTLRVIGYVASGVEGYINWADDVSVTL